MKLGLIAMSGVLAQNSELMELGLTLPGFVERKKVIASLPSLGLLTLAGLTDPSIDVSYIDLSAYIESDDLPGEFDLVGISSFSAQIKDAYVLASNYRKVGTKVVLGGLHVTSMPEEALQYADAIVVGEGEVVWEQVVEDVKNNALKSVYDARGQKFDLANAPMPRFDLLDAEKYNRITVQTQRGCVYNCEFCASSIRLFQGFKVKPIDKVVDEIRNIKSIWSKPFIELADDNTFADKRHGRKLAQAIGGLDVRWFTETDMSVAEDEELLKMLRDSGCMQLLIGFESPNARNLNRVELKGNWKARQLDKQLAAIQKIQSYGISVNGCFIMGLDGADVFSFDEVFNFVKQSELSDVQITLQTPFPGTPLYNRLLAEDRILNNGAWELCTLFDVNFVPTDMSVDQLELEFRSLMSKLYDDELVKARKSLFRSRYKQSLLGK